MNKLSINKILPSVVSIMIVVGMAVQSFATNVDMAAFVKKDKYMTKYYELDWRIDDVDRRLEKLYKFTCTNVRSFGGSNNDLIYDNTFYLRNNVATYHWYANPIVDLSEEGYLRFNNTDALTWFGNHGKTDKMEFEIPASLCRWRNDVELYPHTKVKFLLTRTFPASSGYQIQPTYYTEVIMGPFKKFPYINSTGSNKAFFSTNQRFNGFTQFMMNHVQYARDTDTQPTSWTNMSGEVNPSNYDINSSSLPEELRIGTIKKEQIEEAYSGIDKNKLRTSNLALVPYVAFGVDTSKYDKVWLRFYTDTTATAGAGPVASDLWTITTWNYNK